MTAAEWEGIKALFDAAVAIPQAERARFLDEVCAGQPELRQTLEQLLQSWDESTADPRELEPPVFSPGQMVANRFRILRLIARGGMGEVYEAQDGALNGLRVALKTIRTEIAGEQHAYERFKREVWVARELAHDSICRVFDLVEHQLPDGRMIPCLTMQLLEGRTLASVLSERRPMNPGECLPLVRQIAQALGAMHRKGVVHRDIKPSNIMITGSGANERAVVMDFGLAKSLRGRAELWQTRTAERAGAPYFIAPEVLRGEKGGVAVDIYALGLVLDEMVTRAPAFPNESIEELFWRKLHCDPVRPSERSDELPATWEQTILRCLDRDPGRRPQNVEQVLDGLDGAALDLPVPASAPKEPITVTQAVPFRKTPARRIGRWWLVLAIALTLVPGLALLLGTRTAPVPASVLVYPFANLTRQPEYEYLCVGTADELMRRLTYVEGLRVFPVREARSPKSPEAGQARFALEGSLQHHGGRVRLAVQLLDNRSGALVWSEQFERELRDPLALESDLADKLVTALSQQVRQDADLGSRIQHAAGTLGAPVRRWIGASPPALLPQQATSDREAFSEYLHGRQLWQKRTVADALAAIEHFQRAVARDPGFALAYSALADTQHVLLTYNHGDTRQLLEDARRYAERAVALDPSLPEVHTSLAAVRQMQWDWRGAEQSYRKAIAAQPKFARAHYWFAGYLVQVGRFEEAFAQSREGQRLDPFDYPSQSSVGLYLSYAGRLREAASHLEWVLSRSDLFYAHAVLGQAYSALAESTQEPESTAFFVRSLREAGIVRTRELDAAGGNDNAGFLKWSDIMFAQAHAARGDQASARLYIDRLEHGLRQGRISASAVAWAHAAAGHRTRALELLELGAERRERELQNIKVTPLFQPLAQDPRFQAVLRRMGL